MIKTSEGLLSLNGTDFDSDNIFSTISPHFGYTNLNMAGTYLQGQIAAQAGGGWEGFPLPLHKELTNLVIPCHLDRGSYLVVWFKFWWAALSGNVGRGGESKPHSW